ncbi:MAG: sensor histidine kinase [Verrucomicrobiales bacterium]
MGRTNHDQPPVGDRGSAWAAKMESLGTVNSGVAHSLKNQLAQIQMGIEALRALRPDDQSAGDGTEASVLSIIDGAIDRADIMLDGLIQFSSEFEFDLEPGDLNEFVRSSLEQFGSPAMTNGVTISFALAPDLAPALLDRHQFPQILGHLISNAIEAMPQGGDLIVTTARAELEGLPPTAPPDSQMLTLVIEDSGAGIDESSLAKVFDPFFSDKAGGRGSGLGLTLVKKLVTLHGGTISLENRSHGGGAVATLCLPAAPGGAGNH